MWVTVHRNEAVGGIESQEVLVCYEQLPKQWVYRCMRGDSFVIQ